MKHVCILVPKSNAILSSIVGPYKILKAVNDYCIASNKPSIFDINLVGLEKDSVLYDGAFSIHCNTTIDAVTKTNLIILPAIRMEYVTREIEANNEFIPWIKQQHLLHKSEIASLCLGAFFLAETGLLNGKECATHWTGIPMFRQRYPHIDVKPEKIITDKDGLYSSGGAYSFLNLMLHLVQKYCGKDIAIFISKLFEIDVDRHNQNQFAMFIGQKEHSDSVIKRAQTFIENNVTDRVSVGELSQMFAVSQRNFIRRFKKATSNTPLEYIQRVKIEAAKNSLESSQKSISEVMFSIGYSDTKAFRTLFKRYTGLTPLAYKQRYNREFVSY